MKSHVTFIAHCQVCGWISEPFATTSGAQKAAKQHTNDNPHRDYDDVPLFE